LIHVHGLLQAVVEHLGYEVKRGDGVIVEKEPGMTLNLEPGG
jgi:hypothetical protein